MDRKIRFSNDRNLETIKPIVTPSINAEDILFVDASNLKTSDDFLRFRARTKNQKIFKDLVKLAIKSGLKDFYIPALDPSEENGKIFFKAGNKPAINHDFKWWKRTAEEFCPERGSRLGSKLEYVAFCGWLMKRMLKADWKIDEVWALVCDDSQEIGYYKKLLWNYMRLDFVYSSSDVELTGSRPVTGKCDLCNVYKVLLGEEENDYYIASGYSSRANHAIAHIYHETTGWYPSSVGWIILTK